MATEGGKNPADLVRREASAWIARMKGPDADRSRLAFERWRAASPRHRQVYAEMEDISRATRALGTSSVGREFRGLPKRRQMFARPAFGLATAGVALLLVAGSATVLLRRPAPTGAAVAREQAIASVTGQLRRLRLPDGSSVVLDTDTQISVAFSKGTRLVRLLRGRARFDVAPAIDAPFMVEAGDRMILDRGTLFDVSLGRDGVRVSLLRGAVEIHDRSGGGRPGRMLARLAPGQVAMAATGSESAPIQAVPAGAERWVDGWLSYDSARLGDVVADINRYSARKLRLADPTLSDLRVTGVFRAAPLDGAAQTLASALRLHLATADNGDLLLRL